MSVKCKKLSLKKIMRRRRRRRRSIKCKKSF